MKFGICPECKNRVERKIFRVSCDSCSIQLKDGPTTKIIKIAIHASMFITAAYFAISGTPEFIANHPDNAQDILYWYYMKLFFGALVVSGLVNLAISLNFASYEPK